MLARGEDVGGVDPVLAEQAAELGLARAVLAWRRPGTAAFPAYARAAIRSQIRRIPPPQAVRRSRRHPRATAPVGGTAGPATGPD